MATMFPTGVPRFRHQHHRRLRPRYFPGSRIDAALALTLFVGIVELTLLFSRFPAIHRYGCKPLYMVGSLGMACSLIVLVVAALTGHFHRANVLVFILVYLAFYCFGVWPVFWTLVREIFPNDLRELAMTVPVLVQWVVNVFVVLLFPYAFHVVGKAATLGFLGLIAYAKLPSRAFLSRKRGAIVSRRLNVTRRRARRSITNRKLEREATWCDWERLLECAASSLSAIANPVR